MEELPAEIDSPDLTLPKQIYVDIYRPADTAGKKIPIIMPYSPYGKGGGGANLMDVVPYRVGVPKSRQSGLEKFEGSVDFLGWLTFLADLW